MVGTSSLRRQCQLRERRPDLIVRDLRGNVGTRLAKLDNGDYDAIILAVAGLKRLGLEQRIRSPLSAEECLPAVGQGAVGIECRLDDSVTRALLVLLNHAATETRVRAERAMNTRLEGGCQVPIGSYAELDGDSLWLRALVGAPDGSQMVRGERRGPAAEAERMGVELAEELLARGAREILREVYQEIRRHDDPGNPPIAFGRAVSRLRALGRVAYHAPLIDFAPGSDLPQLPQALQQQRRRSGVRAVAAFGELCRFGHRPRRLSWPAHLTYYAIGRTTGLALHCVSSLPVEYPREREISERCCCRRCKAGRQTRADFARQRRPRAAGHDAERAWRRRQLL